MNQLDAHGRPVPYPPAVKHSHKEGDKVVVLRDDKWYEATKLPKALWPRGLKDTGAKHGVSEIQFVP